MRDRRDMSLPCHSLSRGKVTRDTPLKGDVTCHRFTPVLSRFRTVLSPSFAPLKPLGGGFEFRPAVPATARGSNVFSFERFEKITPRRRGHYRLVV